MISTQVELDGITETVTNSVFITVTKDLLRSYSISHDVPIRKDPNTTLKKKNKDGTIAGLNGPVVELVDVTFDEKNVEGNDLALTALYTNKSPIFKDNSILTTIYPVEIDHTCTLGFKYYNKSRSAVNKIANRIRNMNALGTANNIHALPYHYVLPNVTIEFLDHINTLKNLRFTAPVSFEEYCKAGFDDRLDLVIPKDNVIQKYDLVIHMIQEYVEGHYDGDISSIEVEEDGDKGMWFIEFNYIFTYSKPIAVMSKYPILIYNTLIKKKFRTFINERRDWLISSKSKFNPGYDSLYRSGLPYNKIFYPTDKTYITLPEYDPATLPVSQSTYIRFLTVLLKVSPGGTLLGSIKNLPSKTVALRDSIVNYLIASERFYISSVNRGLISIEIFKNFKPDRSIVLSMDELGNIYSDKPLAVEGLYHLSFSIVTDLDALTDEARNRIKKYFGDERKRPTPKFGINLLSIVA